MEITKIQPFARYVHYIPMDKASRYGMTIPYDNRIFYMYKGTGRIKTDTKTYTLNEGDLIIIPSGAKYQLLTPIQKATYIAVNFDYTRINFHKQAPIPPAKVSSYDPSLNLENLNFVDVQNFNTVTYLKNMNRFSAKFIRLEQEYSNKLLYFEYIISNILSQILLECARSLHNSKYNSNKEITSIVIGYINENFSKPLSNRSIGDVFGLHPNYISNLIKVSTGMPLHQYLLNSRVSHSIELLNQKKYSISEISEKCGFCDIYHYSKAFKKIMGISPSKYL